MKSFLLTYFCIWFFAIIMQMLLWLKIPGYHWGQVKTICGNITPGTNIDLLQNITVNFIPRKRVQRPICCCCCQVTSVVSDSVRPHRWQATRLPRPWDSPGKNTGVGCHFLLQWTTFSQIMPFSPITSWQIDGETIETVADFIFGGSKMTADGIPFAVYERLRYILLILTPSPGQRRFI